MTDIFDEVGEDLRRDRLKRMWQQYSPLVYGAAFLIVAGTASYEGYHAWTTNRANTAGDAFVTVLASAKADDHLGIANSLSAYQSSAPSQYALLARFRIASEHAATGEIDNALAVFEAIANDSSVSQQFRDLAAVRAAVIAIDREDLDKIKDRVSAFANDISPWRFAAREVIALAAVKVQNWAEATTAARKLVDDPATPSDTRTRAQMLLSLAASETGEAVNKGPGS
jgi:hypothetical protein